MIVALQLARDRGSRNGDSPCGALQRIEDGLRGPSAKTSFFFTVDLRRGALLVLREWMAARGRVGRCCRCGERRRIDGRAQQRVGIRFAFTCMQLS